MLQKFKTKIYIIIYSMTAHQDSIWALATSRNETDLSDYIVTGGVDDMVKLWKWSVEIHPLSYIV